MNVLHESAQRASSLGMDINRTWAKLLRGQSLPITFKVYKKAKSTLQSEFSKQIAVLASMNPNHEHRLRHKLERWRLDAPLGTVTRRLLSRLGRLKCLVTPRVQAAVFKTLWNGWCTRSRFQQEGACVLCCSLEAVDRIEHYATCIHQRDIITWFGLPLHFVSLNHFLLVADGLTDTDITLISLSVYAMFRATNYFRRSSETTYSCIRDFLQQACKDSTSGHPRSRRILDLATRLRHVHHP